MKDEYKLDFAKKITVAATAGDFEFLMERGIQLLVKQKHLKGLLGGKKAGGVIMLALVDDKQIKELNRDYRGIDKATDVVSLSYFEAEFLEKDGRNDADLMAGESLLGEIFISVDTAKKQAREHGKTLKQELQFLFAHGLLHVFGYDHERADERRVMFDLQDQILKTKSWRKIID